jgi:hypothetical protein
MPAIKENIENKETSHGAFRPCTTTIVIFSLSLSKLAMTATGYI